MRLIITILVAVFVTGCAGRPSWDDFGRVCPDVDENCIGKKCSCGWE